MLGWGVKIFHTAMNGSHRMAGIQSQLKCLQHTDFIVKCLQHLLPSFLIINNTVMWPLFLVGVASAAGACAPGVGTCRRHRLVISVNAKIKRVKNFSLGFITRNTWQRGNKAATKAIFLRAVMVVGTRHCSRSRGGSWVFFVPFLSSLGSHSESQRACFTLADLLANVKLQESGEDGG